MQLKYFKIDVLNKSLIQRLSEDNENPSITVDHQLTLVIRKLFEKTVIQIEHTYTPLDKNGSKRILFLKF